MDTNNPEQPTQLTNKRSDDFVSAYANNVAFEQSAWDLKLTFGQLDQAAGVIDQHTAISIPWNMAKLVLYHIECQITAHEIIYGKIRIAPDLIPPEPPAVPPKLKDNEQINRVHQELSRIRDEFIKRES